MWKIERNEANRARNETAIWLKHSFLTNVIRHCMHVLLMRICNFLNFFFSNSIESRFRPVFGKKSPGFARPVPPPKKIWHTYATVYDWKVVKYYYIINIEHAQALFLITLPQSLALRCEHLHFFISLIVRLNLLPY